MRAAKPFGPLTGDEEWGEEGGPGRGGPPFFLPVNGRRGQQNANNRFQDPREGGRQGLQGSAAAVPRNKGGLACWPRSKGLPPPLFFRPFRVATTSYTRRPQLLYPILYSVHTN